MWGVVKSQNFVRANNSYLKVVPTKCRNYVSYTFTFIVIFNRTNIKMSSYIQLAFCFLIFSGLCLESIRDFIRRSIHVGVPSCRFLILHIFCRSSLNTWLSKLCLFSLTWCWLCIFLLTCTTGSNLSKLQRDLQSHAKSSTSFTRRQTLCDLSILWVLCSLSYDYMINITWSTLQCKFITLLISLVVNAVM